MIKLADEQMAAVQQDPDGVSCENKRTHRVYFLVDEQIHRAMRPLATACSIKLSNSEGISIVIVGPALDRFCSGNRQLVQNRHLWDFLEHTALFQRADCEFSSVSVYPDE